MSEIKITLIDIELFTEEELNYSLTRCVAEYRDNDNKRFIPKTMLEIILNMQQYINNKKVDDQFRFLSDIRFKINKNRLYQRC